MHRKLSISLVRKISKLRYKHIVSAKYLNVKRELEESKEFETFDQIDAR